ncbi:unnamed protein product [Protopolystoma xenopodis]|uniref:Secreted protein n=1 Tax=Protopolystoma xenopodis TaxID=117903 RepID=A0A3S5AXQ7_9PLAT|nr:unnamed protein product [Protopolystoma xenopodis]
MLSAQICLIFLLLTHLHTQPELSSPRGALQSTKVGQHFVISQTTFQPAHIASARFALSIFRLDLAAITNDSVLLHIPKWLIRSHLVHNNRSSYALLPVAFW